jgi:hypothetical protein
MGCPDQNASGCWTTSTQTNKCGQTPIFVFAADANKSKQTHFGFEMCEAGGDGLISEYWGFSEDTHSLAFDVLC